MTAPQQKTFFSYWWPRACRIAGWPAQDREFRLAKLSEWLGRPVSSATEISTLDDFDIIKARTLAIIFPTNIKAQMRQQEMPRIRLLHRVHELAHPEYLARLLHDKFTWPKWLAENYPALSPLSLASAPADLVTEFRAAAPAPPSLEDLTEAQLIQLRNTLCARRAWRAKHPSRSGLFPQTAN